MMDKKLIRRQIKEAVARLSPQEKTESAAAIQARIEALPLFAQAKTILLFHSLPDEVCTHEWIAQWSRTKNILLPVVSGDTLNILPYSPKSMKQGAFGISEPTGEAITDLSIIDMVIVPGVGFDKNRNRLGRGKGYYDKLLTHIKASFIGVSYDCQVINDLPTEPHDIPMSLIISNNNTY